LAGRIRTGQDGEVRTPSSVRTIVCASAALTVATMPVFLIGALSDAVGADLGIGEAAVGGAATVLLGTAGVAATTAGRITEPIVCEPSASGTMPAATAAAATSLLLNEPNVILS
jgi:hypothetical protein